MSDRRLNYEMLLAMGPAEWHQLQEAAQISRQDLASLSRNGLEKTVRLLDGNSYDGGKVHFRTATLRAWWDGPMCASRSAMRLARPCARDSWWY